MIVLLLFACGQPTSTMKLDSSLVSTTSDSGGGTAEGARSVLLLVLDGIRVDEISSTQVSDLTGVSGEEYCSGIWGTLGAEGTAVRQIHNIGVTATGPAHVALFTGRTEPYANLPQAPGEESLYMPERPTIWQQATRAGVGPIRFVGDAGLLYGTTQSLYPEPYLTEVYESAAMPGDGSVFSTLKELIADEHPRLLVANLHDSDSQGHLGAAGTYAESVKSVDTQLANFWHWLKEEQPAWLANTLVVVTSDHGRHRVDPTSEVPWKTHGDSCAGCRELPLFLVGPGIAAGQVLDRDWLSVDISSLIAGWLSIDLPFARGLPLDDVVPDLKTVVRSGDVLLSADGGHLAVQHWLQEESHRSEVRVDGEVVSSPDAWVAEAPALAVSEDRIFVCWRELQKEEGAARLPWVPRCLSRAPGEAWEDIGFSAEEVGPLWRPALVANGTELWAGWTDTSGSDLGVGADHIRLNHWTPLSGWDQGPSLPETYPVHPSLTLLPVNQPVLSWGASSQMEDARSSRTIRMLGDLTVQSLDVGAAVGGASFRSERSALHAAGSKVEVATLVYTDNGRYLAFLETADKGRTWSEPTLLPSAELFLSHLVPKWVGDRLIWGVLMADGTSGFCGITPGEPMEHCISTGVEYVNSFSVDGETLLASVRTSPGVWEVQSFEVP